ncbi:mCG126398, partial [Mus musculus]
VSAKRLTLLGQQLFVIVCAFSKHATKDPHCARSQTQLPLTSRPLCISGFRPTGFHQHGPLLPQAVRDDRKDSSGM